MIYAYFNDCLPRCLAVQAYANALEQTARGYKRLHQMYGAGSKVLGGIITNSEKSLYTVDGNNISLGHCISQIDDRDIRNLLISWLTNYPETDFFKEETDDDAILAEDYHLTFENDKQNAINLVLAKRNGAFLFTLNLHKTLSVDRIEVHGNSGNELISNLYGNEEKNILYISQIIENVYTKTLGLHKQIENILQKVLTHNVYDAEYSKLSCAEQMAVLTTWKEASDRCLLNPLMPDRNIIKQTAGPERLEKQVGPVYELRVRKPRELRVYFQCVDGTYYLLDIKDKTHQDIDIKNAFAKARFLRRQK